MDATKVQDQRPEDVVTVDVHSAKNLLDSGHRFLDRDMESYRTHTSNGAKTTEEFNKGHIHHAANIPFMFVREEKGYKQVMNMEGGFAAWVDAGLAGDKSVEELKTSSKFHP